MANYDFDKIIDRRGTNSVKWNVGENELPMWVADMDFETAPEIRRALELCVEHGVFGYTEIPDAWGLAYSNWWKRRHHTEMDPSKFIFCTGVIPAISSIVRKLTSPNENVVIQTPVYNIFFNSIINNGCRVLENRLQYDGVRYSIDFLDLEIKLADPQTTLMILCNPHNPIGKIWDRDTLARIGELCKRYHVTVISDEIHCDLTDPGTQYEPFAGVSDVCREVSITCVAPTKAFNIAGLQTSAVYVENDVLRHKVWRALNTDEVAEPNAFAITAAIAAFNEGGPWLDALCEYVYDNKQTVLDFVAEEIPGLRVVGSQATYLLWLDVSKFTQDSRAFAKALRDKTGLFVSNGAAYGGDGAAFLRLNIACPRSILMDGLTRLKLGLESL